MEFAKFLFKFNNKMLPESFNSYFINLIMCTDTTPGKKIATNIINLIFLLNREKNSSSYLFECVEKHCKSIVIVDFQHSKYTTEKMLYQSIFHKKL